MKRNLLEVEPDRSQRVPSPRWSALPSVPRGPCRHGGPKAPLVWAIFKIPRQLLHLKVKLTSPLSILALVEGLALAKPWHGQPGPSGLSM
jgi:hypothetical protein